MQKKLATDLQKEIENKKGRVFSKFRGITIRQTQFFISIQIKTKLCQRCLLLRTYKNDKKCVRKYN